MDLQYFLKRYIFMSIYREGEEIYSGDKDHCDIDGKIKDLSIHKGKIIIILDS